MFKPFGLSSRGSARYVKLWARIKWGVGRFRENFSSPLLEPIGNSSFFSFFFPLPKGRNARVNEAHWKRNRLEERKALLNIRMLECIQSGAQTRYTAIISPRYFKLLYPRIVFYHYISTRSFSCIRVSSCEPGEKIWCEYVLFLRIHLLPSSVINHILTIN